MSLSPQDIRQNALKPLRAHGLFPIWMQAGDSVPTEAEVTAEWIQACQRRRVADGGILRSAVRAWCDRPIEPGQIRRWPAPADVLDLAERAAPMTAPTIPGCGRCDVGGWREVAVHRETDDGGITVDVSQVLCDCGRGEHFAMRRTEILKGGGEDEPRPRPTLLAEYLAAQHNRATVRDVRVGSPRLRPSDYVPNGTQSPRRWQDVPAPVRERFVREVAAAYDDPRRTAPPRAGTRTLQRRAQDAVVARFGGEIPPSEARLAWDGAADGDDLVPDEVADV